mmetsp:Transcript_5230/g.13411  ORF Transcript_5230/g.13411 Transcript_5230/m.13411 type:complete len:150 (-) Transcript_5230:313-762(-)
MGQGGSREAIAATRVQAVYRGHAARDSVRMNTMRGIVLMRTNLPRPWRAETGISGPMEVYEERFLAFAERHLVVSKVPGGCFTRGGECDFVIECNSIERVYTDTVQPGVFAIARSGTQRDVVFKAPDEQTRDDWIAALQKLSTVTSDVR